MPVSGWVKISDIFLLKFIKHYLLDLICGKNKTGILIYPLIEKLNATKKLVNRKICCINFCRRRCFM